LLPPFANDAPEGVLPLWTAEDARRICERLQPGARLVVVGGGILGVEAALRGLEQKLEVTVIERSARLMPAQLGPLVAGHLAETLRSRGAKVLLGAGVAAVRKVEGGLLATLEDGREAQGAAVVVSIGARKSVRLAEKAGLKVERGIVVDGQLRTSAPGIFACGDAIALEGMMRCSAIDASRQGRVAGANAAGGSLEYVPQAAPLGYKQSSFELNAIGPAELAGAEMREIPVEGGHGVLLIKDGVLVGVQVIGPKAVFRELERKVGRRV
jgi:NAD(P)H-nitrite reductase large subunit